MQPLPTDLIINGELVTPSTLNSWKRHKNGILVDLADFLEEWYADVPTMQLHTSGSTGKPAVLQAEKSAMLASAQLSCKEFGLKPGQQALLCLPLRYVAGKMMVVRALAAGLHLLVREPSSTPLERVFTPVDFAAMVPMQAAKTLARPGGAEALNRVHTLLLGGGFIDPKLEVALRELGCRVYASYGMTETLSHIALRRVNGSEASPAYKPLPGVRLGMDKDGALNLSIPHLHIERLQTNDIAQLRKDGSFIILGRRDSVINSGGIKIQAEEIENQLHAAVNGITTLALPAPHPELGECVALLWEGDTNAEQALRRACETVLPKHHRPLYLMRVNMPRTESGKPARAAAKSLLPILLTDRNPGVPGVKEKLIRALDELKQSEWWEKAKDPKLQASICSTAEQWLQSLGKNSKAAKKLGDAVRLLRHALADNKNKITTPRNILILTAVILYTVTPFDSIPDFLPIVGWLDDLGLLTLAVNAVIQLLPNKKAASDIGKEPHK